MYNYTKLQGKIIEKFKTRKNFSKKLGISESNLSKKLNNESSLKQGEVLKYCKLLSIKIKDTEKFYKRSLEN